MTASLTATARMNRMYRRQRHVYDFTRKHYLLGRDLLIERLNPGAGQSVLEIGCGTGRNLIVAARRYAGARFVGIDVSTEMLTTAIDAIGREGLSSRIRVAHADATTAIPVTLFQQARFDRVFVSYSLSMMPGWRAVLDVALSLLAPGGELHIVDFGAQERLPRWFRAGLRRWLTHFDVTPCDDLERALMACAARTGGKLEVERPYRGYAQYAVVRLA